MPPTAQVSNAPAPAQSHSVRCHLTVAAMIASDTVENRRLVSKVAWESAAGPPRPVQFPHGSPGPRHLHQSLGGRAILQDSMG